MTNTNGKVRKQIIADNKICDSCKKRVLWAMDQDTINRLLDSDIDIDNQGHTVKEIEDSAFLSGVAFILIAIIIVGGVLAAWMLN